MQSTRQLQAIRDHLAAIVDADAAIRDHCRSLTQFDGPPTEKAVACHFELIDLPTLVGVIDDRIRRLLTPAPAQDAAREEDDIPMAQFDLGRYLHRVFAHGVFDEDSALYEAYIGFELLSQLAPESGGQRAHELLAALKATERGLFALGMDPLDLDGVTVVPGWHRTQPGRVADLSDRLLTVLQSAEGIVDVM